MDKQKVFDTVAEFLLEQGERSIDECGSCRYRGNNGMKCAVGCLIPDENYHPDMENSTVSYLVRCYRVPNFMRENVFLLRDLQKAHDDSVEDFIPEIRDRLKRIAKSYELSDAVLKVVPDDRFNPSTWGL